MKMKLIAVAIGAVFFVTSPAFATNWMDGVNDSGHDGKHEKWKSPGDGPGKGFGHFKDHDKPSHPDKDKPHGDKPGGHDKPNNPGTVNNGGNGYGGQGGAGGAGGKGGEGGTSIAGATSKSEATGIANSNATGGNAKSASSATGGQGGASNAAAGISGSGNGGGGTGTATANNGGISYYEKNRSISLVADTVDLPAQFLTVGGKQLMLLTKTCGRRWKVNPEDVVVRSVAGTFFFITMTEEMHIKSADGQLAVSDKNPMGFDKENPYIYDEYVDEGEIVREKWGHVLYYVITGAAAGSAGSGGIAGAGAGGAGNLTSGLSVSQGYSVTGYAALPCKMPPKATPPAPPPATPVPPTCVKGAKGGCIPTRLVD